MYAFKIACWALILILRFRTIFVLIGSSLAANGNGYLENQCIDCLKGRTSYLSNLMMLTNLF